MNWSCVKPKPSNTCTAHPVVPPCRRRIPEPGGNAVTRLKPLEQQVLLLVGGLAEILQVQLQARGLLLTGLTAPGIGSGSIQAGRSAAAALAH